MTLYASQEVTFERLNLLPGKQRNCKRKWDPCRGTERQQEGSGVWGTNIWKRVPPSCPSCHVVCSDLAHLASHTTYFPTSSKIQSVFALSDGSGLAVTVARYETPAHTDIDKVSIALLCHTMASIRLNRCWYQMAWLWNVFVGKKVGVTPDRPLPASFPTDEDGFCSCLRDPASCNLNAARLFVRSWYGPKYVAQFWVFWPDGWASVDMVVSLTWGAWLILFILLTSGYLEGEICSHLYKVPISPCRKKNCLYLSL